MGSEMCIRDRDDSQWILYHPGDFRKLVEIAWEPHDIPSDGFRAPVSGLLVNFFEKNFGSILISMFENPQDHYWAIFQKNNFLPSYQCHP